MILDTGTKNLEIVLDGVVTTNQLPVVVSFSQGVDQNIVFSSLSVSNDTTDVVIMAAPSAKEKRVVAFLSIHNDDTAVATVTLKIDDGTSEFTIIRVILAIDDTLIYEKGSGFQTLDKDGNIK